MDGERHAGGRPPKAAAPDHVSLVAALAPLQVLEDRLERDLFLRRRLLCLRGLGLDAASGSAAATSGSGSATGSATGSGAATTSGAAAATSGSGTGSAADSGSGVAATVSATGAGAVGAGVATAAAGAAGAASSAAATAARISAGTSIAVDISGPSRSTSGSTSISLGLGGADVTWRIDRLTRRRDTSTSIDLHLDLLPDRQHRLRRVDVLVADLGDVDETLDPLRDADERAERDELRHRAVDHGAGLRGALELLPGVLLRGLERQRDALALEVDVEHLDLDLLADAHDLLRMVDVLPGELAHVHEPVDPTEVDERAEVHDRADRALAPLPLREVLQEGLASFGLRLLQEGAAD